MSDWIKSAVLVAIFYILYLKISYYGWKRLKVYLFLSELIILTGLIFAYRTDIGDLAEWAVYQTSFIIFLKLKYRKDKTNRYELYDILDKSDFKITIFTNTGEISDAGYDNLIKMLEQRLLFPLIRKNNSVVLCIKKDKILINYLFKNRNDYLNFKEYLERLKIQIKEEEIKQYYMCISLEEKYT